MEDTFQSRSIRIVQFVGRDHFHGRQQVGAPAPQIAKTVGPALVGGRVGWTGTRYASKIFEFLQHLRSLLSIQKAGFRFSLGQTMQTMTHSQICNTNSEPASAQSAPLLIRLIRDAARRQGRTIEQIAADLNVTPGYLHQLSSGIKQIQNVGVDFVQSAAQLLQLPPVIVMMLAGTIRPIDWLAPDEQYLVAERIRAADMRDDPAWSMPRPFSGDATDPSLRAAELCMYEAFKGCSRNANGAPPRLLSNIYRLLLRVGLDQLTDTDLEATLR
ncbi:hypothetical protein [Roseateles koreensis]|uniref:HTH cro/C1-type domain-containing protein n=1 Tax=Roseateles koreensis TaxID=2987526 RepID=A0ABT5KVZ7_9BURK|nr:hypothetical protein [Roseateles koreensis]MDC8787108.1 hypothetical protein [Roseateles koreensis]